MHDEMKGHETLNELRTKLHPYKYLTISVLMQFGGIVGNGFFVDLFDIYQINISGTR